jgi:hypothetical protein
MVCNARGEDLSDFMRRAIRKELASLSFLTDLQKKALGINPSDANGISESSRGDTLGN